MTQELPRTLLLDMKAELKNLEEFWDTGKKRSRFSPEQQARIDRLRHRVEILEALLLQR